MCEVKYLGLFILNFIQIQYNFNYLLKNLKYGFSN